MKKKIVTLIVSGILAASLWACGGDSASSSANASTPTPTSASSAASKPTEDNTPDVSPTEEPTATPSPEEAIEMSLSGLENYLLEKGVLNGNRTETAAEMVGASAGFKYADSNAEIYEFDKDSDAYKKLIETNTITLESFDYTMTPSAVNENYVLLANNDAALSQELIDAFNAYGK